MRTYDKIICFMSVFATALVVCSSNSMAETASQSVMAGRLDGSGDIYLRLADATRETHGWGTPRDRASVTGAPLRIGSVTFRCGIGTHAPAELVFPADGRCH